MHMCSVILISQCPYTNLFPNVGRIQAWQIKNNFLQQQTIFFNPTNEFHKLPLCVPDVQWITYWYQAGAAIDLAEAAFYSLAAAAMGLIFLATEAETACMASAETAASSLSLSLIHFNPFLRTISFLMSFARLFAEE